MWWLWNFSRLLFVLNLAFLAYPIFGITGLLRGGKRNWKKEWVQWGCGLALRVLHCRVSYRGALPEKGMLVSNHQGYMDILTLNHLCPSTFIAKAEIRCWPFFGLFSRWGGTIFIERRRKTALRDPIRQAEELLKKGERVVVFPEGTDSDGTGVLPFHSSFFEAAIQAQCPVIPLAIRYRAPGVSPGQEIIYWKDRRFLPHLIRLLGVHGLSAEVTFGDPVELGGNRKELAQKLYLQVFNLLQKTF
jgi:1-acyl-sn-glycerol-3-phosphate acyltransferase